MGKYIMSLDQGTTSSRCIIFDKKGNNISTAQKEFPQIYPKPGLVEHKPMDIWNSIVEVTKLALDGIPEGVEGIDSIGITNQRETTILWDKTTGEPVYNAIVWQCRRTSDMIDKIKLDGYQEMIIEKTGLIPDAYFSASKIAWILNNVPGVREKACRGEILFGTVDTWLIWKLTGGKSHVTDYTNASRTMLFNIHTKVWDKDLLTLFNIPECILPKVVASSSICGVTDESLLGRALPIAGVAGDQQAALFGQCCFEAGDVKNTYGTGCFLLMNTGKKPIISKHGLLTTIAASHDGSIRYALEGSVFVAGAAVQWLRDGLELIKSAKETYDLAVSVPDSNGMYIVPAFTGLGAPYWNQDVRGTVVGLTRGCGKAHFVRATLESIAYQTYDVLRAMEIDSGIKLRSVKVDGGASTNDFLIQFESDIVGTSINRPMCIETTALGAAYLAGLATGYYKDIDEIRENWQLEKCFSPSMDEEKRMEQLKGWKKAVRCAEFYAKE